MPTYTPYTPMYQPYSNFQPYQPQYQNQTMQTPIQTPIQAPTQQTQNQSSILWVRNGQEAAMYPVSPNNAVALWDSSAPVIYLKQADASGKPTMKTYDLVERQESPQETPKAPEGNSPDYATKAELAALAGVVKDVDGIINSLRKDLDAIKETPNAIKETPKRRVKKEVDEDA